MFIRLYNLNLNLEEELEQKEEDTCGRFCGCVAKNQKDPRHKEKVLIEGKIEHGRARFRGIHLESTGTRHNNSIEQCGAAKWETERPRGQWVGVNNQTLG